jgi:hypothetical protein
MATLTKMYKSQLAPLAVPRKTSISFRTSLPRRCMVISVGLILAGMGVVGLMVLELLPVTFLVAFSGFALTAAGGICTLIFCGEI